MTAPTASIPTCGGLMMASKRSMHAEHSQVGNRERTAGNLLAGQRPATRAAREFPCFGADLGGRFGFRGAHDGRHEAVVGSHRNADVRPRIGQHFVAEKMRIHDRHPDQGERGGAHQ